jgi:YD repeat-containing protein
VLQAQDQVTTHDGTIQTKIVYDRLGRPTEQDAYESSSKWIATTTTYDAWGRVKTVSNPAEYTGASGDGLGLKTFYSYDLLGRVTAIVAPGGATTSVSYLGNTSTTFDPGRKGRQTTTDALGRVVQVVEDPPSNQLSNPSPLPGHFNYITKYTYDGLDQVRSVLQGGQTRLFGYDSVGRLRFVRNPESGTVNYDYDQANLKSRTDARGVITTYTYDNLNRLTKLAYSGPTSTPAVIYSYDQAVDGSAVPFARGRLTAVANANATTTYTSYDALGRVTGSTQQVAATGQTYPFTYHYNLAGSLITETYPSGRTLTNGYDAANRMTAVAGTAAGQTKSYVVSASYMPQGALAKVRYGNQLWRTYVYNSQLQTSGLWDALQDDQN